MKPEGKRTMNENNHPKIVAPIGQTFDDADLQATIDKLLPTASVSQIFYEISKWEDKVVTKDRLPDVKLELT